MVQMTLETGKKIAKINKNIMDIFLSILAVIYEGI